MVTFSNPAFLILAAAVLPSFLLFSFLMRWQQKIALGRFGKPQTLHRFSRFTSKTGTSLVLGMALAALVLVFAGPQLKNKEAVSSRTLNAIVVLDVSRSMLADDGPGGKTRLEASVLAIERLLDTYPDGRFGLVTYTETIAGYAPARDHAALKSLLHLIVEQYSVRGEGSSPSRALGTALEAIETSPYGVDVIYLVTDGGESRRPFVNPSMEDVSADIIQGEIRLVSVGVGDYVPRPIPVYKDGEFVGYHLYQGSVAYTALNESFLRKVAENTGGYYLHLEGADDLVKIARSKNLDSQPIPQGMGETLAWLPVAFSLSLVAFWLLGKVFKK